MSLLSWLACMILAAIAKFVLFGDGFAAAATKTISSPIPVPCGRLV
jgi:hypothetical protein